MATQVVKKSSLTEIAFTASDQEIGSLIAKCPIASKSEDQKEPIQKITNTYFTDEEGKFIDSCSFEEHIYLVVESENMSGEEIIIPLDKSKVSLKLNDTIIDNTSDVLKHTISSPKDQIKLIPFLPEPEENLANDLIEEKAIKAIELISTLDKGSDNSGSGGTRDGMIYDKEYEFRVSEYIDGFEPTKAEKNDIIWEYTYTDEHGDLITVISDLPAGDTFVLKVNNLELLGREISIYAYYNSRENEGILIEFCHNRFRYFDRKKVNQQIEERLIKPWKINQGATSLCGMACIFYILAKNNKADYKRLAETLHRKGEAVLNGYTLEPAENSKEEMYGVNPYTSKEHPWIPEIDWIVMASARSKESWFGYTGKKGQDASAINWPTIMKKLGKELLGYSTVEMDYYKVNKSYLRDFFGSDEKIRILEEDIDKDYRNGYEICMMIDADMVSTKPDANYSIYDFGEYHWVNYEGDLKILNSERKIEFDYDKVSNVQFSVATWGEIRNDNPSEEKKINISKDQFIANYYGFLKLK